MILVFALGNTFYYLLLARGLQGIASTVITVSGKNFSFYSTVLYYLYVPTFLGRRKKICTYKISKILNVLNLHYNYSRKLVRPYYAPNNLKFSSFSLMSRHLFGFSQQLIDYVLFFRNVNLCRNIYK